MKTYKELQKETRMEAIKQAELQDKQGVAETYIALMGVIDIYGTMFSKHNIQTSEQHRDILNTVPRFAELYKDITNTLTELLAELSVSDRQIQELLARCVSYELDKV